MVKYNLGFYKKNDTKVIDLSNILNLKTLQDLDNFTSEFNDERELKIYLVKKGVLDPAYISKDINVVYKYAGGHKKTKVIYNLDKEYLNITNLKNKLDDLNTDPEFLEKLANRYDIRTRYNIQGFNVASIRVFLTSARKGEELHRNKLITEAMDDLFEKAVFSKIDTTGEVIINYRGLRDLAMFVAKYENSKTIPQKNNSEVEYLSDQITFNDLSNYKSQQIETNVEEDDLDFVYPLDNELYTQDGSPFFPPNSEEAIRYQRQLEEELEKEMSIEEHPHYRR